MQKILILLPNNLGDVIMALPVLRALKHRDPATHLTFFVEQGNEGGLISNTDCDRIISFDRKVFKAAALRDDMESVNTMLQEVLDDLNLQEFDAVINLSQTGYLSYVTALVKAPHKAGRRFLREGNHALPDLWSQYLYAIAFARECNALHTSEVYCRIAGVKPVRSAAPLIVPATDEKTGAEVYLREKGCTPGRKLIVLQPGAAYQSKRWPEELFVALGNMLIHDGYYCIITGAPVEKELCCRIGEELGPHAVVSAGERTFRETIALCSMTECIVTGDTALMHAGAALGKRVVALFGPTNPVETGPYGAGHTVFAGECPERPCFKNECASRACMYSIPPELVYRAVQGVLTKDDTRQVYVSEFRGPTWGLESLSPAALPLYNSTRATVVQSLFDADSQHTSSVEIHREHAVLGEFVALCHQMESVLDLFQNSGNGAYLQRFEALRQMAASAGGCSAFMNAILNIRLNSVPLLDPLKGIAASVDACKSTARQCTRNAVV